MEIRRLGDALGAEVIGVDLARPIDAALARRLNDALLEHIVLVLRDQRLTPGQYVEAMRTFGRPAPQNHTEQLMDGHPEIWILDSRRGGLRKDGERNVYGANAWHTDHTNQQRPPKITALLAIRLPPSGGDTLFANAYAMLEGLSAQTRQRIEGRRTVNGADRHLELREDNRHAFAAPAIHPLVRTHPETGRRAIYCHPLKMQHIEGMSPQESFELVDRLLEEAITPAVTYRHRWSPGDLVMFDNRACLHRAVRDYDPDVGRVMHRIIVEGDAPG
ncbi:MAG: TauD/TfdA family dioxygenase [Ectothiorhodospiraceae bacterium]|nr:TauD/TfdA family dioxygenase [Chromatiales bacterium]MCP5155485.1 TauD/TfdA family dioxygenase [Ectothiorhodospiraceae bacterium]